MTKAAFPPELRTAGFVPRWSIVWTQRPDNVAQHSYFVALYAHIIADMIQWPGPRGALLLNALAHDLDEIITGDIVSPVKMEITDVQRMGRYCDGMLADKAKAVMAMMEVAESELSNKMVREMEDIVTTADKLEAVLFLTVERRMGNTVVGPLIESGINRLEAAWRNLSCNDNRLSMIWNTQIVPAIRAHETEGGYGV